MLGIASHSFAPVHQLNGDDQIVLLSLAYITIFNLPENLNGYSKHFMTSNINSI